MRLGIGSYTYVWAVGVPGYQQPAAPMTAEMLISRAVELGVSVVQIADNLPLERLSEYEVQRLGDLAGRENIELEVGACGIEPNELLKYLGIATRLRSKIVRTLID